MSQKPSGWYVMVTLKPRMQKEKATSWKLHVNEIFTILFTNEHAREKKTQMAPNVDTIYVPNLKKWQPICTE